MSSPRIAVLGTGANGAVVGADLIRAGHNVTFIEQWPEHVETIRSDGIRIEIEEEGTFTTRVDRVLHLCDVATLTEPFDIVFMLLKAYDTRWGCELIRPHVAADGVVVGVQNGMTIDSIAEIMGSNRAVGSVIEVSSTMFEPGFVERHSPRSRSWFAVGTIDPAANRWLGHVAELLRCVGDVEITDDILSAKWMKLVINAAELVPSAILGKPIADAARIPEMQQLMVAAGNEALDAALHLGRRIVPIFGLENVAPDEPAVYVDRLIEKLLADYVLEGTMSTVLQDWKRGRHSEVDEINGLVVRTLPAGVAPVNSAVVEVAHRIETGELEPGESNLSMLAALASESA